MNHTKINPWRQQFNNSDNVITQTNIEQKQIFIQDFENFL